MNPYQVSYSPEKNSDRKWTSSSARIKISVQGFIWLACLFFVLTIVVFWFEFLTTSTAVLSLIISWWISDGIWKRLVASHQGLGWIARLTGDARDHTLHAAALNSGGRFDRARLAAERAIKIDSTDDWGFGVRAYSNIYAGDHQSAIDDLNVALELAPDQVWHWANKGCAEFYSQRFDDSLDSYRKAYELQPDDESYQASYANLLLHVEQYDQAREQFESLLGRNVMSVDYYRGLFHSLYQLNRIEDCLPWIDAMPQSIRTREEFAETFVFVLLHSGNERAFELANRWRQQGVCGPTISHALMTAAILRHDYDEAMSWIGSMELSPSNEHSLRGALLDQAGKMNCAMDHYELALSLEMTDQERGYAYSCRGYTMSRIGRFADAIEDWQSSIKLDPNLAITLLLMAWVRATCRDEKFRDGPLAIELANQAIKKSLTRDARWYGVLAAGHAEAGNFEAAIDTQRRVGDRKVMQQHRLSESPMQSYRGGRPLRDLGPVSRENGS